MKAQIIVACVGLALSCANDRTVRPGTRARVPPDSGPLVACTDAALLDFAFDAARFGNAYDARRAMADTRFFTVPSPASVEVKDSELKSRWPKVLVTVLDGDAAGRVGWVVLSQLPDLPQPPKSLP